MTDTVVGAVDKATVRGQTGDCPYRSQAAAPSAAAQLVPVILSSPRRPILSRIAESRPLSVAMHDGSTASQRGPPLISL